MEMSGTLNFSELQENSQRLLWLIYKLGPITKTELCKLLNKKMTPINRMLAPLEESGIVKGIRKGDSTGGRKPIVYGINSSGYYVASVNISSTYYEVAILNFKLEILRLEHQKMSSTDIPEDVLETIAGLISDQISQLGLDLSDFYGLGLAVFSSFSDKEGHLLRPIYLAPNEKWLELPVAKVLQEKTGLNVLIEKGTNSAAFLEYLHGKGRGSKRILYILCAMNIRSAVISDNKIFNDAPYCEDSFGHMTIDIDGDLCNCGNYGCVATFATIPAILKSLKTEIKKGRYFPVQGNPDNILFEDVCSAVDCDNELAKEVITRAATVLGTALASYINMFAPEVVFLSGLIVQKCNLFFEVAEETAKRKISLLNKQITVVFEKDSGYKNTITLGMGAMVIENLFRENQPFRFVSNEISQDPENLE
jgi:predicted NBD/HSP70 family sugar kinase